MQTRSRNILVFIFLFAGLALLAIYWLVGNRGTEQQEDLYSLAVARLAQTNSANLRIELDTFVNPAEFTGDEGGVMESLDIPLGVSGSIDLSYPTSGSLSGQGELDFSAGMGLVKLMKLTTVLADDGQLYAKIEDLPDDVGLSVDVQGLDNAWFSFSGHDLSRTMPWLKKSADTPQFANAVPVSADVLRSSIGGWLQPQRQHPDTVLAGQAAAHYDLLVDQAGLAKFLSDATGTLRGQLCSVEEKAAILKYVETQSLLAEAWVSRTTGNLLMLKLGIFPEDGVQGLPLALTLAFGEFDQPVKPETPASAIPLSTVLKNMPGTGASQ